MKLKKLLSIILISVMLMAMTACGDKAADSTVSNRETNDMEKPEDEESNEDEASADEESGEDEVSEDEESNEDGAIDESSDDVESDRGEDAEESPAATVSGNESVDLSNAVTETTTSEPADMGQWIQSTTYSTVTKQYETMYWRIVDITFDCQEDIDRFNGEGHAYSFEPLENEDFAYCMATYEVYFPEDFPTNDWGITAPEIAIRPKSPDGGGIKYKGVAYIGLGTSYEIAEDQETFPGEVYTGKALYVMIHDDVDYVFEYSHQAQTFEDQMLYDYAANK